jgi:hypothetical protein
MDRPNGSMTKKTGSRILSSDILLIIRWSSVGNCRTSETASLMSRPIWETWPDKKADRTLCSKSCSVSTVVLTRKYREHAKGSDIADILDLGLNTVDPRSNVLHLGPDSS